MIPTFIILFREVLEMALIIGIVLAATHNIAARARFIWLGLAAGLIGAGLVALFTEGIANAMEGMGQEALNAAILIAAAFMIGWTVVWMSRHGREIALQVRQIGHEVSTGKRSMYALTAIIGISMLREGSEVVLFMYGVLSVTQESIAAIIAGGVLGALAAAVLGLLLYLGLIRLSAKYMFRATGILLTLVACGMSAHAAGYLAAAGWLPELAPQLWDSSWLIEQDSAAGILLSTLIGYIARPSGMQLVWYLGTAAIIIVAMRFTRHPAAKPLANASAAA